MSQFVPGRRVLLAALAATTSALGLASPALASDGTQSVAASIAMTCTKNGGPAERIRVGVTGTAPLSAAPGEEINLAVTYVSLQKFDDPGTSGASPFIYGNVQSIKLQADGGAPSDLLFGSGNFTAGRFGDGYVPTRVVRGGQNDGTETVKTTAGSSGVTFRVTELQYGFAAALNTDPPTTPFVPSGITCVPEADTPPVVTVRAADTTPKQRIDASIPMTCSYGTTTAITDILVGIKGYVPTTTVPGREVLLSQLETTLTVLTPGSTANYIWGAVQKLDLSATGATPSTIQLGPGGFKFTPRTPDGYGPVSLGLAHDSAVVTAGAQGDVALRVSNVLFGYGTANNTTDPLPPYVPTGMFCTPASDQPAFATIKSTTTTPVNVPVISRVYGSAWAGFGGLVRIHGSKLGGAKYVTFGAKKVRPLLVLGSTDVWVLAPPLPKGTYPVAVGTATAVSLPGTGNTTSISYR